MTSAAGSKGFNLIGSSGTDTITATGKADTFTIASSGQGNLDVLDGAGGADTLQLSAGSHVFASDANFKNIETVLANTAGSSVNLSAQTEGFTITGFTGIDVIRGGKGNDIISSDGAYDVLFGGEGDDTLTGGADNDELTGGAGADTFNIDAGEDSIADLSTTDILKVSSGAKVNANNISAFVATDATENSGTANLYAGSGNATIDVRLSSAGAYNIFSGSGTDTLKGSNQNDTITILNAGEADNDSIDGHTGDDILQLSSGTHTITTDGNLSGIETIKAHKDGSVTDFSNQTENLIFIGNDGNDTLKGGTGNDQLTGGSGADTFSITGGTDIITDLQTTDIIINANGATANASNISSFIATSSTKNLGSAANVNLTAKTSGGTISVANATGTGGFNLIGSASADTLTGSGQDDTFTVSTSTAANSDTIDGGSGTDKLILSSGSHTFSDNTKLVSIEQVQMNASDSTPRFVSSSRRFYNCWWCRYRYY